MDKDIKVSVCCLAYNHEKYISQCLDSILQQRTNFRFEVIVHEDASTDGTADILRDYAEKYPDIIVPVFQKENQYSKKVRIIETYFYARAKGKYLAFCECDDFWTNKNKLQFQYDFLEDNSDYSATTHKMEVVDANGNKKEINFACYFDYYLPTDIDVDYSIEDLKKWSMPGQLATRMIRKECVIDIPQIYSYSPLNEDRKMTVLLLRKGKIRYFSQSMSAYRYVIEEGFSWSAQTFRKNMCFFNFQSLCEMEQMCKELLGEKVNFSQRKEAIYFEAVIALVKHPNKTNYAVVKKIHTRYNLGCSYTLQVFTNKILDKITGGHFNYLERNKNY